jgi:CMP/dCMP kinase
VNAEIMSLNLPPVITIDGPSGTGKGTICRLAAKTLGWHCFDSGAIYRILAYAALAIDMDLQDEIKLQDLAASLDVQFQEKDDHTQILFGAEDITLAIRTEQCSSAASKIAALPGIRQALLKRQRAFRQWPGLVTDGRDMGTIIFPDASIKFFLSASAEERAQRRFNQLKKQGIHANLAEIFRDLLQRDARDQERNTAPLIPADDALLIDTTKLTVTEVFDCVMQNIKVKLKC